MQRPIITIPFGFLRTANFDWDIDWHEQSLGEANSGASQTLYNAFPRWTGGPGIFLQGKAVAQWRAIRAQAQGRIGMYRIRMCDPAAFRLSDTGVGFTGSGSPFSTGQPFSTGYGFEYVPTCSAKKSASAGATEIRIENAAAVPVPGQIMSHNYWPFAVTYVTAISAGVYDLGVQMPLRAPIAAGDVIKLRGEGLFEALESGMGRMGYGPGIAGRVQLSFREVLSR
ncbi:hypothetical protein [Phaeobacter sp. 22II1-1F12B]|uniref:hypothetical protein n=1 Tax=Phaeobacter sp. 22II1-1F12B TaxID=1317111 RepID=UPI000B52772D|nr:hypothetical protein [Phaeobacter sp. 22II1-1F12B]OWU80431.1 hypothetical protein ATO1_08750 [Phaeobacter sp. 22II1-1F12B]